MSREGFLQRRGRGRGLREKFYEVFLRRERQPDHLDLRYRLLRSLLSGGDDKIADRASLDFSGAPDHRQRIGCDARFQTCGSGGVVLRHIALQTVAPSTMYVIPPYRASASQVRAKTGASQDGTFPYLLIATGLRPDGPPARNPAHAQSSTSRVSLNPSRLSNLH